MLYCDARKYGIPEGNIRVQGDIYTSDKGIDGFVENSPMETPDGLIRTGLTCYQVKSGSGLRLKGLVLNKNDEIHEGVKACLDSGGTFIGVLFGWSGPTKRETRIRKLRAYLGAGYEDARVDTIAADQLAKMFESFPACLRQIIGLEASHGEDIKTWANRSDMSLPLEASEVQKVIRNGIGDSLRKNHFIRLTGEAGRGKTRIAIEAVSSKEFALSVLYFESAKQFHDDLVALNIRDRDEWHLICVVDECDFNNFQTIFPSFRFH